MLKATPAGLAEQAAGGGGLPKGNSAQKGNSAKKATMPKRQECQKGKKQKNCQNRQAGRRKEEKRGKEVGKKKSRGIGGGTRGTSGSARSRGVGTVLFSALELDSEL